MVSRGGPAILADEMGLGKTIQVRVCAGIRCEWVDSSCHYAHPINWYVYTFATARRDVLGSVLVRVGDVLFTCSNCHLAVSCQAITFLALLAHLDKDRGPHLVVAPASLLENWQREIARWCPSLRTILYHGSERKHMLHDLTDDVRKGRKPRFDILLVCYSMFERDRYH